MLKVLRQHPLLVGTAEVLTDAVRYWLTRRASGNGTARCCRPTSGSAAAPKR